MNTRTAPKARARRPLSRKRVLRAAIEVADEGGIQALTMRRVGQRLRVEAMSLYNHVANKDDILDGIVDLIVSEFEMPTPGGDWRSEVRRCAIAAHAVLSRHPWMPALAESRVPTDGPRMAYYDALMRVLREGGFSVRAAYRAGFTLDSYLYGFALQEASWPTDAGELAENAEAYFTGPVAERYPFITAAGRLALDGIDLQADFEAGLEAVLDGLERLRDEAPTGAA